MIKNINRTVKYMLYSLLLLIFFIINTMPSFAFTIFGVRPLLLLAFATTISFFEPEIPSIFFGLACGILIDVGVGGPVGLSGIVLPIICCAVSVRTKKKRHATILSSAITGAWALALIFIADWLLRFVAAGYSEPNFALINSYLPKYLYTFLVLPLVYLLNMGIYLGMRSPEPCE